MRPDDQGAKRSRSERRHAHRGAAEAWPKTGNKTPPPAWNNKMMHHPATRIGEIKHGKT